MNGTSRIPKSARLGVVIVFVVALAAPPALAQRGGGGGDSGLTAFVINDFSGSGNCATCHSGLRDGAGTNVSIDTHWRSTMMANSAKDPLWQAKIESEVNRSPVAVLGYGFLDPAHPLNAAARNGISCTLCHQIQNIGLGEPATFTGS